MPRAAGYNPRVPIHATGVILAGGKSRRLGAEKPLQVVGGASLIERVVDALSPCVDQLLLVTNRPELYSFLGLETIPDIHPGRGPLAGMQAAFRHIGSPSALVVAGDYPFLTPTALKRILREDPAGGVVLPQIGGQRHPLCAHYASSSATQIEEALAAGELMVLSFVARLRQVVLDEREFGGESAARVFFNVNTPEDLRHAEGLLGQAQPRR